MKTLQNLLLLIVSAIFLSGCYYTVEPVYFEKDRITDDAILGTWGKPNEKGRTSFTKDENGKIGDYLYVDNNAPASFKTTLVKIGKYKYLDMFGDKSKIEKLDSNSKNLLLECHTFMRYSLENDKLTIIGYDIGWIEKKIKSKEIDLHYFIRECGYYFSDSTENLQKVIISLEDTKEAFSKEATSTLERVK